MAAGELLANVWQVVRRGLCKKAEAIRLFLLKVQANPADLTDVTQCLSF